MSDECSTPTEVVRLNVVEVCACLAGGNPDECSIHRFGSVFNPKPECTCGSDH